MANLNIQINTSEFDNLLALGDKYVKMMDKSQNIWTAINQRVTQIHKSTTVFGHTWSYMRKDWDDIAKNIAKITSQIFSWKTYLGVFKGLMGSGNGLFGMQGLASSASEGRRKALGIGDDYGKMNSFLLNFQRLVDAQSLLSRVSTSKYDVTSGARIGMISLGLGGAAEAAKTPSEQARDALRALPDALRNVPQQLWLPVARAKRITDVISEEDIVRRMNDPEGYAKADQMTRAHEKDMSLTKQEQNAWTVLNVQLANAGKMIETVFQRKLMNLAASSTDLSAVLTEKFARIINSKGFDAIVKLISDGLDNFAKWLNSDDIDKKMQTFADNVAKFIPDINTILAYIHKVASFFMENDKKLPGPTAVDPSIGARGGTGSDVPGGALISSRASSRFEHFGGFGGPTDVSNVTRSTDIPSEGRALLDSISAGESRGNYNARNSIGAYGRYQFMPGTRDIAMKALGLTDFGPVSQDKAAWWLAGKEFTRKDPQHRNINDALKSGDIEGVWRTLGPNPWEALTRFYRPDSFKQLYKKELEIELHRGFTGNKPGEPMQLAPPPSENKSSSLTPSHAGKLATWQGRNNLSINVYAKAGSNFAVEAGRLGLGPA